jgi:hypothetical protein
MKYDIKIRFNLAVDATAELRKKLDDVSEAFH